MVDQLIVWLNAVPPWAATMIMAMTPIAELRGALPVALTVYDLPIIKAMALAVVGNMVPVYFILVLLEVISKYLSERSQTARKFFDWLYSRTRRKLEEKVKRYGPWALAVFVAIPLPATGAWTGALAAYVFGMPRRQAFMAILVGVCIAAVIVTLLTLGISVSLRSLF